MSFNITDKMKGLLTFNATEGKVLGRTGRVAFDRKTLCFKYWAILDEESNKEKYYLRFSDILRVNENAVLCFFEQSDGLTGDWEDDANIVYLVGNTAVSANNQMLGTITSVQLDSLSGEVISFSIKMGNKCCSADRNKINSFVDSSTVMVDCVEDDFKEISRSTEAPAKQANPMDAEAFNVAENKVAEPFLEQRVTPITLVMSNPESASALQTKIDLSADQAANLTPNIQAKQPALAIDDYSLRQPVSEGQNTQERPDTQIHIDADVMLTPEASVKRSEFPAGDEDRTYVARPTPPMAEQPVAKPSVSSPPRQMKKAKGKSHSIFWRVVGSYVLGAILFTCVYIALSYFNVL